MRKNLFILLLSGLLSLLPLIKSICTEGQYATATISQQAGPAGTAIVYDYTNNAMFTYAPCATGYCVSKYLSGNLRWSVQAPRVNVKRLLSFYRNRRFEVYLLGTTTASVAFGGWNISPINSQTTMFIARIQEPSIESQTNFNHALGWPVNGETIMGDAVMSQDGSSIFILGQFTSLDIQFNINPKFYSSLQSMFVLQMGIVTQPMTIGWAANFGNGQFQPQSMPGGITIDPTGQILYITGILRRTATFGGSSLSVSNSVPSIFAASINVVDRTYGWYKIIGVFPSSTNLVMNDLMLDSDGNIIGTGTIKWLAYNYQGNFGTRTLDFTNYKSFLFSLSADGSLNWIHRIGQEQLSSLAYSSKDNFIYLAAFCKGSDSSIGSLGATCTGNNSVIYTYYNSGMEYWTAQTSFSSSVYTEMTPYVFTYRFSNRLVVPVYSADDGSSSWYTFVETCSRCGLGTSSSNPVGPTCPDCPKAYYSDIFQSPSCKSCPEGTFGNVTRATSVSMCPKCPAGTYTNAVAQLSCKTCLPGTYSARVSGSTGCLQCPAGTFSNVTAAGSNQTCSPCPIGTFNNVTGATSCIPCGVGTYSDTPGAEICKPCGLGLYYNGTGANSTSTCLKCAPGSYSDTAISTGCKICRNGTYADAEGSSYCTQCYPGTYSGEIGANSSSTCIQCIAGTYSTVVGAATADVCIKCPLGYFSGSPASLTCVPCSKGYYADEEGLSSCKSCPVGTFGLSVGATTKDLCIPCPAGTFGQIEAQNDASQCISCRVGTYSSALGAQWNTSCIECPAQYHIVYAGAKSLSECLPCPEGTYSIPGSAVCSATCPPKYCLTKPSDPSQARCIACSCFGLSANDPQACSSRGVCVGIDECQCRPGYTNSSSCEECPIGTYSSAESRSCTACPAGTFSETPAAGSVADCIPCPAGYYSGQIGASSKSTCIPCPVGTFSTVVGSSSPNCTKCKPGTMQPKEGGSFCELCPPKTFLFEEGGTACNPCNYLEFCSIGTSMPMPANLASSDQDLVDPYKNSVGTSTSSLTSFQSTGSTQGTVILSLKIAVVLLAVLLAIAIVLITICTLCMSSKLKRCGTCVEKIKSIDIYSLKHFVAPAKSPVNEATCLGAFFSVLFLLGALAVLCFLVLDMVENSILEQSSVVPPHAYQVPISGDITIRIYMHNFLDDRCYPKTTNIQGLEPDTNVRVSASKNESSSSCAIMITCPKCYLSGSVQTIFLEWDSELATASSIEYYFGVPHFLKDETFWIHEIISPLRPESEPVVFRGKDKPTVASMAFMKSFRTVLPWDFFIYNLISGEPSGDFDKSLADATYETVDGIQSRTRTGYVASVFPPQIGSTANGTQFERQQGLAFKMDSTVEANLFKVVQVPKNQLFDFLSKVLALVSALNGVFALILINLEKFGGKVVNSFKAKTKKKATSKESSSETPREEELMSSE